MGSQSLHLLFCFVCLIGFVFFNDLDNHEESGVLQNVPQFGSYHFYQLRDNIHDLCFLEFSYPAEGSKQNETGKNRWKKES